MAEKTTITKDSPPDVIEQDIVRTRKEMSETIDEIVERISTEHWKAVARETIREKVNSAASRGKALAGRARDSALKFGRVARDRSLNAKGPVLQFIKNNQTAALVIGFELGAWIVIASKSLMNRKRKMRVTEEAGGTEYARAKIMSIEEVEQKVKEAALAPEEESFKKAA
jgi:hypothetical protein